MVKDSFPSFPRIESGILRALDSLYGRKRRQAMMQEQQQPRQQSPQSQTRQQQRQQQQRQTMQRLLVVRSFLRHSVSAVCRSRMIGTTTTAEAEAAAEAAEAEAETERPLAAGAAVDGDALGGDGAASDGRMVRDGQSGGDSGSRSNGSGGSSGGGEVDWENENEIPPPDAVAAAGAAVAGFRPASFGDVPSHLLQPAAASGGCCPGTSGAAVAGDEGNNIDDGNAPPVDQDATDAASVASALWDWLEGCQQQQRRRRQQLPRDRDGRRGMLDRLLLERAGAADVDGGEGFGDGSSSDREFRSFRTRGRAATLVVATWVRDVDDEEEDDEDDNAEDGKEERSAQGTILERFRFSLLPRSLPSSSISSSSSSSSSQQPPSSAAASTSAATHYFGQLRSALRSVQEYCDGAESRSIVDPGEHMDYEAIGRGFTMIMEEDMEEVEDEDMDAEDMNLDKGGDDDGGHGLFTHAGILNPLDARKARAVLRRNRRVASGDDAGAFSSSQGDVGSALMTDGADTDTDTTCASGLATMMMAQQSQSQNQSHRTSYDWTQRTERTDRDENRGGYTQSQSRSQLTDGDEGHTHSQYSDDGESEDGDEDDENDDEGGRMVRYHLGSIDLGDCQLSVAVERSYYSPDSPVIRLLFGGDDDCSDDESGVEDESPSESQYDGDVFSVSTALPSQGTMGYSSYRRMHPVHARPTHDANLGGLDDASNGSMVTPPPPMSTVQVRANNGGHQTDLDASIESTQPSQGTNLGTQQSSITEGASQRSRRRKGPKKKQSARARANADVSKIMGVRRRDCIPKTRKSESPPALTPMPPAGSAARSTGKRPALASALRNGSGGGGKRPALPSTVNRSTRFSPLPKIGNGGGNTPMRRGVGPSSRSPAISSTSTVLVGSANNTPVPMGGASGRSPAISGTSTATVLMSRYGSVSEAETVLMSRTTTPPRKEMGRQG